MSHEASIVLRRERRNHVDWHACPDINGNNVDFRGPATGPDEEDELCPLFLALTEALEVAS